MINNELKIKGRAYRYTVVYSKTGKAISNFGLQFYNGKDAEGKSKYAFVNCKCFSDLKLEDKQDVIVCGRLASDEWVDKLGKKQSKLYIVVDKIEQETEQKEETQELVDDEIPF